MKTLEVISFFKNYPNNVISFREFSEIHEEYGADWTISSFSVKKFIERLIDIDIMDTLKFDFPNRTYTRYFKKGTLFFEVISSIPDSYFSHYSAMYLNGLTDQIPKSIYINAEQSPKPSYRNVLEQSNIDLAFSRKQRTTNNICNINNQNIYFLNGKNTNQLGIVDFQHQIHGNIRTTNIERTLIDIVVRPAYSGGVFEILKAFEKAHEKVSINKLVSYLNKLDYTYPYHQVIGLYLEKTGLYNDTQLNLLKKLGINYNFYLTHAMKEKSFDETWKVYYPKNF